MTVPAVPASPRRELPPSMVERMTLILDSFERCSVRLTLEDVARRTHLPRSTAHRILDQLVRLDWLRHTAAGYSLGRRALRLGGRANAHGELRNAAAPLLHDLQMRTGMVVHLAVLDGVEIRYLDKVGGRFAASVPSRVGGRAPAHSTALGKAMLAWLEPEAVDELLGEHIGRLTDRTIADLDTLHQELDRIRRRRGLAFERGECVRSLACAAVAVRGPEGPVGSISLVGRVQTPLEKVAPLVVDAARQVSDELHPPVPRTRSWRQMHVVAPERTWSSATLDRMMAAGSGDWF
ncbi:transcriptional regulator, IclR family [Saccharopolyspora kobensis]|uniref:Transcriptional regulator, IclR family n=1 Tax=Saccharopolyspora kobensis TaxID=146035 RepID=A0A1H5STQ6_9PSEU|nr:IclR family transcriptional regulator [Saccharopolyspora kobensis]SEF53328.1 transcriptional regulator, IclR family [Saccharopolyspora kobensis]SFC54104.1 transcriptional regulator, IclR family [Saccharopolyspora kobensis]